MSLVLNVNILKWFLFFNVHANGLVHAAPIQISNHLNKQNEKNSFEIMQMFQIIKFPMDSNAISIESHSIRDFFMNECMRMRVRMYWNLFKEKEKLWKVHWMELAIYCLFFEFESEMGNYFIFL